MNWSVGVTTVPSRRSTLLPNTLASLRAAGFDEPWIFVDGAGPDLSSFGYYKEQFGIPTVIHTPKIGALANWLLGLHELWLRNPKADRFLMVQDDVVFVRDLRQYLEEWFTGANPKYTDYWNLYNFEAHESAPQGFQEAAPGRKGKGALALCFDNPGVQMLLRSPAWADAVLSGTDRAHKRIDGTVSTAFRVAKGWELVHWPSLCQHVGEESTLGNPQGPTHKAPSFPGENFDAMEWLK